MTRNRVFLGAALLAMTAACGGDDGSGPSASELAGSWRATKYELVSVENPAVKIDAIAMGGVVTVTLLSGGSFTITAQWPGEPAESFTGTWEASSDVLTLKFVTGQTGDMQFDMTLSGNTLTLGGADGDFDFDDDGEDDPAKVSLVLTRQ